MLGDEGSKKCAGVALVLEALKLGTGNSVEVGTALITNSSH